MHVYLLSVITTIAAGATLAAGALVRRFPALEPLQRFAANSRAARTLGVIAAAVGFVKLFARAPAAGSCEIYGGEAAALGGGEAGAVGEAAVGFVKLFARAPGQAVIVGDFLPAVAGMLLGGMLLIDRYRDGRRLGGGAAEPVASDDGDDDPIPVTPAAGSDGGIAKIGDALAPYRTPLGLAGIAVGVIHFLLAGVLFL